MNFEFSHTTKNPNAFSVIHSPIIKKRKVQKNIDKKDVTINIKKDVHSDENVLSDYDIIDTIKLDK